MMVEQMCDRHFGFSTPGEQLPMVTTCCIVTANVNLIYKCKCARASSPGHDVCCCKRLLRGGQRRLVLKGLYHVLHPSSVLHGLTLEGLYNHALLHLSAALAFNNLHKSTLRSEIPFMLSLRLRKKSTHTVVRS